MVFVRSPVRGIGSPVRRPRPPHANCVAGRAGSPGSSSDGCPSPANTSRRTCSATSSPPVRSPAGALGGRAGSSAPARAGRAPRSGIDEDAIELAGRKRELEGAFVRQLRRRTGFGCAGGGRRPGWRCGDGSRCDVTRHALRALRCACRGSCLRLGRRRSGRHHRRGDGRSHMTWRRGRLVPRRA